MFSSTPKTRQGYIIRDLQTKEDRSKTVLRNNGELNFVLNGLPQL